MSAAQQAAAAAAATLALEDRWHAFAAELATNEHATAQLLERHQADGRGMCRACTTGGTGERETAWPCSLWTLAHHAWRHAAAVDEDEDPGARAKTAACRLCDAHGRVPVSEALCSHPGVRVPGDGGRPAARGHRADLVIVDELLERPPS